jgi:hypothetical protein
MRIVIFLLLVSLFASVPAAAQSPQMPKENTGSYSNYCSGLIGNSLAFAFASGVSVAVPTLSAGFLAASLAFALAASVVC